MMEKMQIRLSGSGGQGIITAGIILAEAALLDGNNALQSQSYGPEARGGSSKAEVIISSEDIEFPKVTTPNILLSLTQPSYDLYRGSVASDATVIVDSSINALSDANQKLYSLPILATANDELKRPVVANIIALGVIAEITGCISATALEQAVLSRVPKGTEELNKKALAAGVAMAKRVKESSN